MSYSSGAQLAAGAGVLQHSQETRFRLPFWSCGGLRIGLRVALIKLPFNPGKIACVQQASKFWHARPLAVVLTLPAGITFGEGWFYLK